LKYRKHAEDKEVSDSIRFVDKYDKEIPGVIEYDTDTGYASVYELSDPNNPRSQIVQRQKPYPQVKIIVDNIVNPTEEDMQKIRDKKRKKD
jgi:hypothetical protein